MTSCPWVIAGFLRCLGPMGSKMPTLQAGCRVAGGELVNSAVDEWRVDSRTSP